VSLQPGATVYLHDHPYVVKAIRPADRGFQISFEGIDNREAAEAIRGREVLVAERRTLGEGEFWPRDLIGLSVVDVTGQMIGVVNEVIFGPGQDRLVVTRSDGAGYEVPFVDELVPVVDLAEGRIVIAPIPGLLGPE